MHYLDKLVCLLTILLIFSGFTEEKKTHFKPERVVISGKVLNFSPDKKQVALAISRLGVTRDLIYAELDSIGNFSASFESYTSTDVFLQYWTNFLVLTHPGDSIYVEFDDKQKDRPELLKTIMFSGDAAKTNQDAAIFQRMYYSNAIYNDWDAKGKAIKVYDLDKYRLYLDTLQQKSRKLYDKFVTDVSPNEETKIWALTNLEGDYYDALASYPSEHRRANNLKNIDWDVPTSYYDPLLKRFPITAPMLMSGYALSNFINSFHYEYVITKMLDEEANKKYKSWYGFLAPSDIADSLTVNGIVKYTPDSLLRQLVLAELFSQKLEHNEIVIFEKYRKVVDQYIKEPFLREPLLKNYLQTKKRIEHPTFASDVMMKKIDKSSAKQIMDSILLTNKGKVIYLDCWATWCGPCISEMPHSKDLMKKMEGKEVAFVYLCLDSEEKSWKASVSKNQISGQNYFLTGNQSTDLRKVFDVNAVPYYFLIDKKGTIVEKGSYLRPNLAKDKIEKLLKKGVTEKPNEYDYLNIKL